MFLAVYSRILTPGTEGVTLWPCIFIYPPEKENERLLKHEEKHLEQWKRYWILGFPFVYIYQFIRHGYKDMSLEIEARIAERE